MQNTPTDSNQGSQQGGAQKPSLSWQTPNTSTPQQKPLAMSAPAEKPKPGNTTPPKKVEQNNNKSSMSSYVSVFIVGLIIGILIGWGVVAARMGGSDSQTATSTSTTATSQNPGASGTQLEGTPGVSDTPGSITLPAANGAFSIASQSAGLAVAVTQINVSQPTWVVIYDDNNGTLGRALGAHLFFPTSVGGQTSGTIDLLRGTLPGQTYFAGESLDDGDHMFSTLNDKPVRDDKGNPITARFSTK